MNRYLMDRASRRSSRGSSGAMHTQSMDGRNPYGSRGGYVSSRRSRRDRAMDSRMDRADYASDMARGGRGRDRMMDRNDYAQDYRYDYQSDYAQDYDYNYDGHYPQHQYGGYAEPMEYEMYGYGIGGMMPRYDYRGGRSRNSRGRYDGGYDYASQETEKEYKEDLDKWIEKLKKKDRFGMTKDQFIQHSKQMGIKFDKYTEDEFYATFLMMVSDYKSLGSDPNIYLRLSKEFLEDDDAELKGSEKICAYLYTIVLGEEE